MAWALGQRSFDEQAGSHSRQPHSSPNNLIAPLIWYYWLFHVRRSCAPMGKFRTSWLDGWPPGCRCRNGAQPHAAPRRHYSLRWTWLLCSNRRSRNNIVPRPVQVMIPDHQFGLVFEKPNPDSIPKPLHQMLPDRGPY